MGKKEVQTTPIIMYYQDYIALKARANNPIDPVPEVKQRPKHAVKINRFPNKKPTVLEQYNKRVREAQAGGGANARAYALRMDELDEVKNLRTQLRAMEVNEGLGKQVTQKISREEAEALLEEEQEAKARAIWEQDCKREYEKELKRQAMCLAHQKELRIQRDSVLKMKVLEEERREQENKAMRIQMEAAEREEREAKRAVLEKERKNAEELRLANERSERYILQREEEERKNELLIDAYNRRKEAEAYKRELERQTANAVREKEIARLRELQEKSNDKRAEEDQKRALAYQEQRILKQEAAEAEKLKAQQELRDEVLRTRAIQIERLREAYRLEFEREVMEVQREKDEFLRATAADVDKDVRRKQLVKDHWKKVDVLSAQRVEDKSNQKQEIKNWDQKFAMEKAVYDHEVSVAYNRMLNAHKQSGHAAPKHFRDGAEEARANRRAQRKKAQVTRPLW